MTESDSNAGWLTVHEAAERLGHSEATIRRMIRAYELPASRQGRGSRAPWMINAAALERQLEIEAHKRRIQESGIVVGRGEEFVEKLQARHPDLRVGDPDGPTLAEHARATIARHELFERVEREMYADPGVRQQLERLDEADRFEHEARELARRVRRAEDLRKRAQEILDEEDHES